MRSKVRFFFTFFIILALVCISPSYATGQTSDSKANIIRIAIPISSDNPDTEEDSAYVGYTVEYLHEISQYNGWQYEIIKVPGTYEEGLQKALNMIRAGTADLVAPIQHDEDVGNGIYFSQNSFVTGMTVLQIPNSVYNGAGIREKVRVAALDGSIMKASANAFFKRNNIIPEYISCRDIESQIETVCSGDADVMLNSDLEHIANMSIVAEFSPQPLYFASKNKTLLQSLDSAIIYTEQANASLSDELYEKYISGNDDQELTLEEKSFIEQAEPYAVAILENHAPYQFIDDETGEYRGIAVDILNDVSQKTGLQFNFVLVKSWDELFRLINEDSIQIVAEMPYDYSFAAERELTMTRSYASSPYVLLARTGFQGPHSGQRLALTNVSSYSDGYYVGDVSRYSSMEDCIEAVQSDEADYTYVDLYTAQYFMGESRYKSMELIPQSYTPRSICFGITKPTSHELLSILNKSINQLSAADLQNIITQNVNPQRPITVMDLIIERPLQSFVFIGTISLLLACLLIFLLWRKEKISRILQRKAMEDGLTRLYNTAACRKLITQKLKQMKPDQIGVFMIMDMDNFKVINDDFGHQTGDMVLQQFAKLLRDTLRDDSIIARIGGDEFVVYLESIRSEENITIICNRLRNATHTVLAEDRSITISIGAVAAKKTDSFDTLYKLADSALYHAKNKQKDQFYLAKRND